MKVNEIGELANYGTVLFSKKAAANVISLSRTSVSEGFTVTFEQDIGFEVTNKFGSKLYFDYIDHGIYACDFSPTVQDEINNTIFRITTVADNELMYTKREIQKARQARQLQKRLSYPTSNELIEMIKWRNISNNPCTEQDEKRADLIYGKDISSLKEKTTSHFYYQFQHHYTYRINGRKIV